MSRLAQHANLTQDHIFKITRQPPSVSNMDLPDLCNGSHLHVTLDRLVGYLKGDLEVRDNRSHLPYLS